MKRITYRRILTVVISCRIQIIAKKTMNPDNVWYVSRGMKFILRKKELSLQLQGTQKGVYLYKVPEASTARTWKSASRSQYI